MIKLNIIMELPPSCQLNKTIEVPEYVDFIVNKNKNHYINISGYQSIDSIHNIYEYLCAYNVWDKNDAVNCVRDPASCISDLKLHHDISFVLKFYNENEKLKKQLDKFDLLIEENKRLVRQIKTLGKPLKIDL
jgi:hypothetical protein